MQLVEIVSTVLIHGLKPYNLSQAWATVRTHYLVEVHVEYAMLMHVKMHE